MAITFVETVQAVMDLVRAKEQLEGELTKAREYIKNLEAEVNQLEAYTRDVPLNVSLDSVRQSDDNKAKEGNK